MKKRKRKLTHADEPIFAASLAAALVSLAALSQVSLVSAHSAVASHQISPEPTSGAAAAAAATMSLARREPPYGRIPAAYQRPATSYKLPTDQPPPTTCRGNESTPIRVYRRQTGPLKVPQAEPDFGHATRPNFHLFYPIIDPLHRAQLLHRNNLTASPHYLKKPSQQASQQLVDSSAGGEQELLQPVAEWTNSTSSSSQVAAPCSPKPSPPPPPRKASYVEYEETGKNNSTSTSDYETISAPSSSNVIESEMSTNRSQVSLVCEARHMLLRLRFRQPFRGLVISDLSRARSCHLVGSGALYYEMRLPLDDCGTRQPNPRLFLNNIQIQFRDLLRRAEEQDELKTLICSYPLQAPPPTIVPRPSEHHRGSVTLLNTKQVLPERIVEMQADTRRDKEPAALVYYEPLILIVSLLLLALTLLGLTSSAYLLMRRRKRAAERPLTPTARFLSQRSDSFRDGPLVVARPPLISVAAGGGDIRLEPSPSRFRRAGRRLERRQVEPKHSADSLGGAHENSSVTTIEIPFTPQPQPAEEPPPVSRASSPDKSPSRRKRKSRKALAKQQQQQQVSQATQADTETPTFGSLRASLTSPREFRRLQEVVRIFDEIQIENQLERGPNRQPRLYQTTRLNPSKYKGRILDSMTVEERQLMRQLLEEDELFRSQVLECTKLERFNRKLRHNHLYADLFSPGAWDLLADILLDPHLESAEFPEEALKRALDRPRLKQPEDKEEPLRSSNRSSLRHRSDSLERRHHSTATYNSDSRLSVVGRDEYRVSMKELIKM